MCWIEKALQDLYHVLIQHSGYANGDRLLDGSENSSLYFPALGEVGKSIKKHILTVSLHPLCVPAIKTGSLLPVWVIVLSQGVRDFCLFVFSFKE